MVKKKKRKEKKEKEKKKKKERERTELARYGTIENILAQNLGLPKCFTGKVSACQCRSHRFNHWIGKILWSRKWQSTPVYLPRKFHGQRSLVRCNTWGCGI